MGAPDGVDVWTPIEHGDFPASYVNLPGSSRMTHVIPSDIYRQDEFVEGLGIHWREVLGISLRHLLQKMVVFSDLVLPKTNSSPLKIGRAPRGNDRLPTIHVQLLVSGRVFDVFFC